MISEANRVALQAAGLSYILGTRIPLLPDVVRKWCQKHPTRQCPISWCLTQPWPATSGEKARGIPDRVIYCQFRHDQARRTLRGIDEQIAEPRRPSTATPRSSATDSSLLTGHSAQFVIDAYHQLWRIEKSFRMSKHDLQARPIHHHIRESNEAHLIIGVAAMAVCHWIEVQTSWSIKKFVRTARRYRTVHINAAGHTLTAADPLPNDLREALIKIRAEGMH
jgi:hypothetical protein